MYPTAGEAASMRLDQVVPERCAPATRIGRRRLIEGSWYAEER